MSGRRNVNQVHDRTETASLPTLLCGYIQTAQFVPGEQFHYYGLQRRVDLLKGMQTRWQRRRVIPRHVSANMAIVKLRVCLTCIPTELASLTALQSRVRQSSTSILRMEKRKTRLRSGRKLLSARMQRYFVVSMKRNIDRLLLQCLASKTGRHLRFTLTRRVTVDTKTLKKNF